MVIQQIEDDILERLNIQFQGVDVDVQPMPEDEASFRKQFERPRLSLVWIGDDYDNSRSTSGPFQDSTTTFQLFIQARYLRNEGGVYYLCDMAKDALRGFTPKNATRQTLFKKIKYLDRENGMFTYYLEFTIMGLDAMDSDEEQGPNMSGITFNLAP